MTDDASRIRLVQTVLDSTDARKLAEFYRSLLGLDYAEWDAPPPADQPDEHGRDWLVLRTPDGAPQLAFQQVTRLRQPDRPDGPVLSPTIAGAPERHIRRKTPASHT
ncbi:VOC family protein [Streptomyces sp. NPDC000070]|uniref:VOC family protein n=1 Tax=Streptomyces sp. NPDC000070 TaxID=3154240 RepID=UPI0033243547